MQSDVHQRARALIDERLVSGISEEEQRWLGGHLAGCAECAEHAEVTTRILAGLKSLTFDVEMPRRSPWRRVAWIAAAALAILAAAPIYRSVSER